MTSPNLMGNLWIVLCAVLPAAVFVPLTVYAGTGTYKDGKFNFCVSVRFN